MLSYNQVLCLHRDVERVDEHFVKCYECGETVLLEQHRAMNKKSSDFVKEDKSFRNRTHDDYTPVVSSRYKKKKFYVDRNWINILVIDYGNTLNTKPLQYRTKLNGHYYYLILDEIVNVILKLRLIEIDEKTYNRYLGYHT